MPSDSYILFCAGEDSGDCIGESLLNAARNIGKPEDSIKFLGAGGPRMQNAGLKPIVGYETLPVSGFGDVLPRYLKLYCAYKTLECTLKDPSCLGIVAIDYPGFNMKLVQLAGKLHKPSLYIAPPQAWAWKAKRAKQLAKVPYLKLAVFFDFEKAPYENAGCNVTLVQHPFLDAIDKAKPRNHASEKSDLLLFPGSRESQMRRNLSGFLALAKLFYEQKNFASWSTLFSRKDLLASAQQFYPELDFHGTVIPQQPTERASLLNSAKFAIATPGTTTLELALCGCPAIVITRPDFLTYHLGKRFVKAKYFSLPSLILGEQVYPEFILHGKTSNALKAQIKKSIQESLAADFTQQKKAQALRLRQKLSDGLPLRQLMLEFLAQFLKR